jgi:hypothetical protein
MSKTFTLELKFVLDEEDEQKLVRAAQRLYAAGDPDISFEDEAERPLAAEEAIDGPEAALMRIIDENEILNAIDIRAESVSCTGPNSLEGQELGDAEDVDDEETDDEDDLDEWEDRLYLCRWPNGEFSVVKADTKRDALVQLDEWACAEPSWITPLDTFMADFRLDDSGQIEFNDFGEETKAIIRERCYPELEELLSSNALPSGPDDSSEEDRRKIKAVVDRERTRLWSSQSRGPEAKTELGKQFQSSLGTTGAVADHYVELAAKQILKSKAGEGGKPN